MDYDELERLERDLNNDDSSEEYIPPRTTEWTITLPCYPPMYFMEGKELTGDKLILPPSILNDMTRKNIQFPLFFRATNLSTGICISCRAYEFNGNEGVVIASPWLMEALLLESADFISLAYTSLPKATSITLRAEKGSDYLRWSNQKAVLETSIKRYATVTLDTTICIEFGAKEYSFTITKLEPAPFANLIDTDVNVEMEDDEPLEFMNENVLRPMEEKKKEFSVDELVTPSLSTTKEETKQEPAIMRQPQRKRRKRGEKITEETDPLPSTPSFSGAGHSMSTKVKSSIPSSNVPLHTTTTSVTSLNKGNSMTSSRTPTEGVHSNSTSSSSTSRSNNNNSGDSAIPPNSILCENCKRHISQNTFRMHEPFCLRNNHYCKLCDCVVPKAKKEEHFEEMHKAIPCKDCAQDIDPPAMEDHLANQCPKRKIRCEFCVLLFIEADFIQHVALCGSRTEKCDTCGTYVQLHDFTRHMTSNCAPMDAPLPQSTPEPVAGDTNDLHFCPICYMPFMNVDDLFVHMGTQFDALIDHITSNQVSPVLPILSHLETITSPHDILFVLDAIFEHQPKMLQTLLDAKTLRLDSPVTSASYTRSLLHFACEKHNHDIVTWLAQQEGIDIDVLDSNGSSPLHIASKDHSLFIIDSLLSSGASWSLLDAEKNSPLMKVLQPLPSNNKPSNQIEIVTKFILHGSALGDMRINAKQWRIVKDAIISLQMNCYEEEDPKVITNIIHFLEGRKETKTIQKIQQTFAIRAQNQNPENFISVTVNENSFVCEVKDRHVMIDILNVGTLGVACEAIFPEVEGVSWVLVEKAKKIAPNESGKILVTLRGEKKSLKALDNKFITLKCSNANSRSPVNPTFYSILQLTNHANNKSGQDSMEESEEIEQEEEEIEEEEARELIASVESLSLLEKETTNIEEEELQSHNTKIEKEQTTQHVTNRGEYWRQKMNGKVEGYQSESESEEG